MMRRTIGWLLLLTLGAVCAPLAGAAPPAARVSRIGFLASGPPPPDPAPPAFPLTALRDELRDRGYVEGHTVHRKIRKRVKRQTTGIWDERPPLPWAMWLLLQAVSPTGGHL
jgi:hypothetical protein